MNESNLIILPNGRGTTNDFPDLPEGYVADRPRCGDCGRKHIFKNPVGVQMRPSWIPGEKNPRFSLDARCAECREKTARFRR